MIDEDLRRKAISRISFSLGGIILIAAITRQIVAYNPVWVFVRSMGLAFSMLLIPRMMRSGWSTQTGSIALIGSLTAIGINAGFGNGGMWAPAVVIFVLVPVIGSFCFGRNGSLVAFSITIVSIALLTFATSQGWVIEPSSSENYLQIKSIIYSFAVLASLAIGYLFDKSRTDYEATLVDIKQKAANASKMAALGEMAAGVAHEINNPLAIISGNANLVRRGLEDKTVDIPKLITQIKKIEETTLRISKIVAGLRLVSRSEEADPPILANVSEIIEESLSICADRFQLNAIELKVIPGPPDTKILCHPGQILQIMLNLIGNAIDAVSLTQTEQKAITISWVNHPGFIEISVADNGPGIDPNVAHRIMDPFFTTKPVGKGTGLGLSISQGIALAHGGELKFHLRESKTFFVVTLPLAPNS